MSTSRRAGVAFALGSTAVAFAVGAPILRSWFVGDDLEEIWDVVHPGASATQDSHAGRNFRPLTWWTHDLVFRAAGLDPTWHHAVSILLHVGATLLVVALTRSLLDRAGRTDVPPWTPLIAGAVFLVMPNHTEAVSWIAARGDLLATVAVLVALVAWIRPWTTVARTAVGLVAFGAGLAAKESAVVLPFVLSAFEVCSSPASRRDVRRFVAAVCRPWAFYAALLVYLVARRIAMGTVLADSPITEFVGDSVPALIVRTASLVVRSWAPGIGLPGLAALGGLALAGALLVLRRRRSRGVRAVLGPPWPVGFALVASVLVVVPVGHLGAAADGTGGERLLYLATAFVAVVVGWAGGRLTAVGGSTGRVVVAVILSASVVVSVANNVRWGRAASLAADATAQMGVWPADERVYLLAAPDTLGSSYALLNAVAPALAIVHGWRTPVAVDQVSTVRYGGPDDRVDVTRGPDPSTWTVRLLGDGAVFEEVASPVSTWEVPGVEVEFVDRREIRVRFEPSIDDAQIWYFSDGAWQQVDTGER